MVSPRFGKKTILAATDESWHSPIDSTSTIAAEVMPPAHRQRLITDEPPSYESLKGYNHTLVDTTRIINDTQEKTFSVIKQQGGGSWLLGFARLNEKLSLIEEEADEDLNPPGLVRVDSDDSSSDSEEDDDASATSVSKPPTRRRRGVAFSEVVTIQPIPHSSDLSPLQRRHMYSTCQEVRQNKIRNKKEYRYDGYDWRNATEEWEMSVDMVTGDLVHPVHEFQSY